jgi:hypothetical protein
MNRGEEVQAAFEAGTASVGGTMAGYALDAVDHAAAQGVTLDFSEDSLRGVEAMLDRLAKKQPRGLAKLFKRAPSPDDIEIACKMYGGYIGEVMRFEWSGGDWLIPESGVFEGALVLRYGEGKMTSPPAKVYKRLVDGPSDDIWLYYGVLKAGLEGGSA